MHRNRIPIPIWIRYLVQAQIVGHVGDGVGGEGGLLGDLHGGFCGLRGPGVAGFGQGALEDL